MKGDASTTLMSVLREGFQIEQTRVHHRIYVCDPAKVRSTMPRMLPAHFTLHLWLAVVWYMVCA